MDHSCISGQCEPALEQSVALASHRRTVLRVEVGVDLEANIEMRLFLTGEQEDNIPRQTSRMEQDRTSE